MPDRALSIKTPYAVVCGLLDSFKIRRVDDCQNIRFFVWIGHFTPVQNIRQRTCMDYWTSDVRLAIYEAVRLALHDQYSRRASVEF
jgi:hypothetical protein